MARIAAVCGVKNSGKTTLLVKLVHCFREKGLRVGVIKHDGHDFVPDVPGTDSYRFQEAGAEVSAVFSGNRWAVTARERRDETFFFPLCRELDVLLLEGLKSSPYPKIEVLRREVSCEPVCLGGTLLAIAADFPLEAQGVPVYDLDDAAALAEIILSLPDTELSRSPAQEGSGKAAWEPARSMKEES